MDDQRTDRESGHMLETFYCAVGLAGALWLGMAAVDMFVAIIRREWRFSIRSALLLTAVISLMLGVIVTVTRK